MLNIFSKSIVDVNTSSRTLWCPSPFPSPPHCSPPPPLHKVIAHRHKRAWDPKEFECLVYSQYSKNTCKWCIQFQCWVNKVILHCLLSVAYSEHVSWTVSLLSDIKHVFCDFTLFFSFLTQAITWAVFKDEKLFNSESRYHVIILSQPCTHNTKRSSFFSYLNTHYI